MQNIEGIKSPCPDCCCPPERIIYRDVGRYKTLRCPSCGFYVNCFLKDDNADDELIDYWNRFEELMERD